MILADATWPEVDALPREALLLPVGATEQHGPHLPIRTDTLIAEAVARAVHDRCPGADLAPALPIAASGEHAAFPGTLSIGTDALTDLIVELTRHTSAWWPALLLVNGHGGNSDALGRAVDICRSEGRVVDVVHLALPGMDAHAGRAETALLLHLAPHLVRLDRIEAGPVDPVATLLPALRERGVRSVSGNGVLGDPRGATAGEGRAAYDALVAKALRAYGRLGGDRD